MPPILLLSQEGDQVTEIICGLICLVSLIVGVIIFIRGGTHCGPKN